MGVIILFFGVVVLIGFKISDEINTHVQASDIIGQYDPGNNAKTASSKLVGYYPGILDNSFLFLAIGMGIATIILAALVRVHPIFIPLFFIGLIVVIFGCGLFSNIYQEMAATGQLSGYANQLTFTSLILNYLPLIVGVFGILLMIVMYKLWSVQE